MGVNWTALGLAWLRILAGIGMATHGFAKVFGGQMAQMIPGVAQLGFPFPAFFAWAAALSEFAGGVCLAAGLGTRLAAGFIFVTMSVALFRAHAADPFSTKELAYLYWAISGSLMCLGGGPLTLERLLTKRSR
jgi:putative oxidoreductase